MSHEISHNYWAYGVIIGMVSFMGFITYLVVGSMRSSSQLVSEDYYAQEINYQQRIENTERLLAFTEGFEVEFYGYSNQLQIQFPKELLGSKAEIKLIRPSNSEWDFSFNKGVNTQRLVFDFAHVQKGLWKLEVLATLNNQNYFFKKNIMI